MSLGIRCLVKEYKTTITNQDDALNVARNTLSSKGGLQLQTKKMFQLSLGICCLVKEHKPTVTSQDDALNVARNMLPGKRNTQYYSN